MSESPSQAGPIAPADRERYRDAAWALRDPDVQQRYDGQWVVAYERRVIAHGADAQTVLEQANQIAGRLSHRLVFCARDDPAAWLENTREGGIDFRDG
jgi:hypothetical protein